MIVRGVVAGMLLAAAGWFVASAAQARCAEFESASKAAPVDVDQGTIGGRQARTAYFRGGVYRTTVCSAEGRPVRGVLMAPQRMPDGGIEHLPAMVTERRGKRLLQTFATRGDVRLLGSSWRRQVGRSRSSGLPPLRRRSVTAARLAPGTDEFGVRAAARVARRSGGSSARLLRFRRGAKVPSVRAKVWPRANASAVGNKCTLNMTSPWGVKWNKPYNYYLNLGLIPTQFRQWMTVLTWYGHHTWQFRYQDCGWSQAEIFPTGWLTYTLLNAATPNGSQGAWHGGTNVIDAGPLTAGPCSGAVGCAWLWSQNGIALQGNVRVNHTLPYTDGWAPGHYDFWSLMAHEAGHIVAGLGDLYASPAYWAVMYGYINTNDATKRLLSYGEYQHVTNLYSGMF